MRGAAEDGSEAALLRYPLGELAGGGQTDIEAKFGPRLKIGHEALALAGRHGPGGRFANHQEVSVAGKPARGVGGRQEPHLAHPGVTGADVAAVEQA